MCKSKRPEPNIAKSDSGEYLWGKIHVWVLHLGLSGSELATYVALRSYANTEGVAWPSVASIAARANLHTRTVQKCIARLRSDEIGLIVTEERRRNDGSLTSCLYRFSDSPPGQLAGTPRPGDQEGPRPYERDTPASWPGQEQTTEQTTSTDQGTDKHSGPREARGPKVSQNRKRHGDTETDIQRFGDCLARNGEDLDDQTIRECYSDFADRWGARHPGLWIEAKEKIGELEGFIARCGLWYEEDEILEAQLRREARTLLEQTPFTSTGQNPGYVADFAREISPSDPMHGMGILREALTAPYETADRTMEARRRLDALRAPARA